MSFLWRNVDGLIAMQDYIEQLKDCERPSYADVANKKVDQKYASVFSDPTEFIDNMKAVRKKKTTVFTIGLWPLDFESFNDWRLTSHGPKIYPEYVKMAQIEIHIIAKYRSTMFKKCSSAAHIRTGLAKALAQVCKPTSFDGPLKKGGKTQKTPVRRFIYADKLACDAPTTNDAPEVDVVDLKQNRDRLRKSEGMAAEAISLLKKIEYFKGAAAVPGSSKMDTSVSKAVTRLRKVRRL